MPTFTEAVAAAIAHEETTDAFGLMGAGTVRLTHHLTRDQNIVYHAARHEAGAVGAADGYGRVTRRPGVAVISWGPALTNTVTALTTANRGRSPVVLVAADSSGVAPDRNLFAAGTQRIDQVGLLEFFGVTVVRAHPRSVHRDVAQAFALARDRSAPVALLLPMEYETAAAWDASASRWPVEIPSAQHVDEEALSAAVDEILASERPIVLAGRGAVRAGARDVLMELADKSGALLATTLLAKDFFAAHRYNLGVAGGYSGTLASRLFAEADCVVAFGASLGPFTTWRGRLFPNAVVVQCDIESEAMIRNGRPAVAVHGDALEVAARLVTALGSDRRRLAFRTEAAAAGLGPDSWRSEFDDCSSDGALDPRTVCRRLDDLLPAERTITVDAGAAGEYPPSVMSVPEPRALIWTGGDFGAVGAALGPAIGAAVGRPDRLSVLVTGDGGLFMAMQELDMAVRHRIRLLVVCLNDRGFGSEFHHMRRHGLPDVEGARFATPDLAVLARSLGCEAEQISSLDQLDSVPARLDGLDRPLVLDCLITQELVPSQLRQHFIA
jgi:thiamine pyrophosphate-dependent acetolactate synthase large subunit-like protein